MNELPQVVLVRSTHLASDSRSTKMIADYEARGFKVTPLMWSRGIDRPLPDNAVAFTKKGLVGSRFRNLFYFLRWHAFIARYLLVNWRRKFIVHCVDFDTGLVAVPLARLTGKAIVYDAFDHFGSSFGAETMLSRLFLAAERYLIRQSDIVILPDPSRAEQYGLDDSDGASLRIISNMPEGIDTPQGDEEHARGEGGALRICYIGTLEAAHRGLEFIPELCAAFGGRVHFTVGGVGVLEEFFRENSGRLPNLEFIGYQPYAEALKIMAQADCLYGPYLLTARHHRYAAPNKMFEHLALGRPLITNTGTPPGRFVHEHGTGFLFDGSYENLRDLIGAIDHDKALDVGRIANALWTERYATMRSSQVESFFELLAPLVRPGAA